MGNDSRLIKNPIRCICNTALFFVPILFFLSCSSPRYVVVNSRHDVNLDDGDKRYICLNNEDARAYKDILGLRTTSGVTKYRQTKKIDTPVGEVLYAVIAGKYVMARDTLNKNWDAIPDYLRLLMKADLASELEKERIPASQLAGMYQQAFEAQTSDLNRDIIKIRIRQLRYGR